MKTDKLKDTKDIVKTFDKYWGAMFECGDFEALRNDIEDALNRGDAEWKKIIDEYLDNGKAVVE